MSITNRLKNFARRHIENGGTKHKEREVIAKRCEKRIQNLNGYNYITSIPEDGKPYLLKEFYSESKKNPGILVELARCKGKGKSKFEMVVQEANKERKKLFLDYDRSVTEFYMAIKQIQKVDVKKFELTREFRNRFFDIINEINDKLKKNKYTAVPINSSFISSISNTTTNRATDGYRFCRVDNKNCICDSENRELIFGPEETVDRLTNSYINLRKDFLKVFKDREDLENIYGLIGSNWDKGLKIFAKRMANYEKFTEYQKRKWKEYLNNKKSELKGINPKNIVAEDRVKLLAAEYMSNLKWKELDGEKTMKEAIEILCKKGYFKFSVKDLRDSLKSMGTGVKMFSAEVLAMDELDKVFEKPIQNESKESVGSDSTKKKNRATINVEVINLMGDKFK